MKQNLIIRASAGTGKTFSLATRFIRLMLFQNVAPERIVALTFSRAAAQEIYMKLLERLWRAATDEVGAAAERKNLLDGLDNSTISRLLGMTGPIEAIGSTSRTLHSQPLFSPARFAEILRRVIATQHCGTIATLDSFILRIVRSFPLEMGFQNAVDVLDGFGERRAVAASRAALLNGDRAPDGFMENFRTATGGEFVRTCSTVLGEALAGWRDFMLTHREECASWTAASMRAALGIAERPVKPDLSAIPQSGGRNDPRDAFVRQVDGYAPDQPVIKSTKCGEMAKWLWEHSEATGYAYFTPSGKEVKVECGAAGADAVREGVRYMLSVKLGHALDVVAAKLTLCRWIEREYDESTRRRGLLTFADFTDCQAVAEDDAEAALRLENLQFRFDSRFDHWALDEFQDTSELQWRCLRRLVREAAQEGGGRTVMAVGDLKQSIYTWRGGNDAPFKEMMDAWPEFSGEVGEVVPNDISFRYGSNTADFVNRVFGPGNVRVGGVLGADRAPAVDRWLSKDCWMDHRAARHGGDFVEVVSVARPAEDASVDTGGDDAERDDARAAMKILAPALCTFVADIWKRHEAARSIETIGILVRDNSDGAALAERLRSLPGERLPVVWEGASTLTDSPVVRAVLELLKLADHPQDDFAWVTVNALLPVRRLVFPDLTHQAKVSAEVSRMLSRMGLARTLGEIVARLCAGAEPPDARTRLRLEALVREGVSYERRADATAGVGDFVDYLHSVAGRDASNSPRVIRILTIHRSKGLTFDHVVVPIPEAGTRDTIVKPRRGTPLVGRGWALDALSERDALLVDATAGAWRQAADARLLEQLRLYYVALTRARKSTHVFVCRDEHAGIVQFRDLLLAPFAAEAPKESPYGTCVCSLGEMPEFGHGKSAVFANPPWGHGAGDGPVERRSPSSATPFGHGGKISASTLFAGGSTAASKGTAAHAGYAAIEWIDPAAPANDAEARMLACGWRPAFVRTPEVTALWRERDYEIFADGVWETGRFDRVVFSGGKAAIYDFKTNALRRGETEDEFARRMAESYAGQMGAYRKALATLTGLAQADISAVLLLEATGAAVTVATEGVV